MQTFKPGDRVRLKLAVERHPFFVIPPGTLGTVTVYDPEGMSGDLACAIKLDEHNAKLDEWDNELHWLYDDLVHGCGPERSLELLVSETEA